MEETREEKEDKSERSQEELSSQSEDSEKSQKMDADMAKGLGAFFAKNAKGDGVGMTLLRKHQERADKFTDKGMHEKKKVTNEGEVMDIDDLNIEESSDEKISDEDKSKLKNMVYNSTKRAKEAMEMNHPKIYQQMMDRTHEFLRNDQESSRYYNIINLTKFKKSYELDLKTTELQFDPIFDNMVFLMKFTFIMCEKIKRFFQRKFQEQGIQDLEQTDLFKLRLEAEERSTLKSIAYRVVYFINQIKNFIVIIIQKNILTPKFYLLYTQQFPGEYKTLRELQTNINGVALTPFIKKNKSKLEFIDLYFRRNAMKFLTIRRFKRVFSQKYLESAIIKAMSFFTVTDTFRTTLCDFMYYYNTYADFFYIFQPTYQSSAYIFLAKEKEGKGSEIQEVQGSTYDEDLKTVIRVVPRKPSAQQLQNFKMDLVKQKVQTGVRGSFVKMFKEMQGKGDATSKNKLMLNKRIKDLEHFNDSQLEDIRKEEKRFMNYLEKAQKEEQEIEKREQAAVDNLGKLEGGQMKTEDDADKEVEAVRSDDEPVNQQTIDEQKETLIEELEEDKVAMLKKDLELNEQLVQVKKELGEKEDKELMKEISVIQEQIIKEQGEAGVEEKLKEGKGEDEGEGQQPSMLDEVREEPQQVLNSVEPEKVNEPEIQEYRPKTGVIERRFKIV